MDRLDVYLCGQLVGALVRDGLKLAFRYLPAYLSHADASPISGTLPLHGTPSTHIIKPQLERFPESVENEHLLMQLAGRCGLETAASTVLELGGRRYYVTRRYDREIGDGKVTRLHQEDFCQLLKCRPEIKYQDQGGDRHCRTRCGKGACGIARVARSGERVTSRGHLPRHRAGHPPTPFPIVKEAAVLILTFS